MALVKRLVKGSPLSAAEYDAVVDQVETNKGSIETLESQVNDSEAVISVPSEAAMTAKWNELNTAGKTPVDGRELFRSDLNQFWKWDAATTEKGVFSRNNIEVAAEIAVGNTGVAVSEDVYNEINVKNVQFSRKNLLPTLPENLNTGKRLASSGVIQVSNENICSTNWLLLEANTTYSVSGDYANYKRAVLFTNENDTSGGDLVSFTDITNGIQFTTGVTKLWFVLDVDVTEVNGDVVTGIVQLEKSSTVNLPLERYFSDQRDFFASKDIQDKNTNGSLKNLVYDGAFKNNVTTDWSASSTSTVTVANNTISITGTGSNASSFSSWQQELVVLENEIVFVKLKLRVTNSVANYIDVTMRGSVSGTVTSIGRINNPIENKWYDFYKLVTLPSGFDGDVQLECKHNYIDASTANGKVLEVQNILVINCTTDYGVGNIPTETTVYEVTKLFKNGWFDGFAPITELLNGTATKLSSTGNDKDEKIYLRRFDATHLYVYYKPKGSKWIRHKFYKYVNAPVLADVWVTEQIQAGYDENELYPDEAGFSFVSEVDITNFGSSHEFSYFIQGDDYRGTRHGYESFDYFTMYGNGLPITILNGQTRVYSDFRIVQESKLISAFDDTTLNAKIYKQWIFDRNGLDYHLTTDWKNDTILRQGLTWQMPVMVYDATLRPNAVKKYGFLSGNGEISDLTLSEIPSDTQGVGYIMFNEDSGLSFKSWLLDDWVGQMNNFVDLEDGTNIVTSAGTGFRKTYFARQKNTSGQTITAGTKWEIRTRTEPFLAE